MEITEDAEESPIKDTTAQTQVKSQNARQRSFSQVSEATVVPPSVASAAPQAPNDDISTPTSPDSAQINGFSTPVSADYHSERPASSRNLRDDLSLAPSESRQSTQSARPSLQELERAAGFKPKVKLGPRPSVDGSGRPRTAGTAARSVEQRPVASLPSGIRASPFRKSNPPLTRPRSQGNPVVTTSASTARVPPVPPLLVPPSSMPISRPQLSPGAKSLSALSTSTTSNEKERLMKALQLRKSQMQKRAHEAKQKKETSNETNHTTRDLNDDKENIGLHSEKPTYDKGRQRLSSISEHDSKGPPPNVQPETKQPVTIERDPVDPSQVEDHENVHSEISKEEPVVETVNDQSDYTLPSTTYSPADSQPANLDENLKAETPPSEPETVPVQEDSTGSTGNEIKCGTGSPSAVVDVPPEDNPEKAREEEEIIATAPPVEKETIVANESELDTAAEAPEPVKSPSLLSSHSPESEARSEAVTDTSTITPSNLAELQNAPSSEPVSEEQQNLTTRKDKSKPVLEPIQVPTPDYSDDDHLLSDDSFMEELKSATVEEAKPISVGKTPLSPGYSNGGSDHLGSDAWRTSRAVSNPSAIGTQYANAPAFATARSVSSPFSQAEDPTSPVLVAKKINVSSGISKRIKALEQFSGNREGAATPPNLSTPTAASFGAARKRASVSYGTGNSEASLSRHSSYAPEPFSRTASLRRPDSRASTSAERPTNSVSVTARIIRDPFAPANDSNASTEPRALNLQASPLTVEHGTPDEPASRDPTPEATPNQTEPRSMSFSSTSSAKPPAGTMPRSESRLSVSSRNDGYFLSKSPSETSASSPEEKKESRASRLIRRMSSITSPSRRSTVGSKSPALKEEDNMPSVDDRSKTTELSAPVDIGELNVQFPDTLLWKRRFIRIDSQGYIVLTPGNMDSSNRNLVKRYHLTEFKTPCIPDEEREELSNSILLDFLDGSTLQCACESRQGQAFVLQSKLPYEIFQHYTGGIKLTRDSSCRCPWYSSTTRVKIVPFTIIAFIYISFDLKLHAFMYLFHSLYSPNAPGSS